ncbi:MAG: TrbI/VirB10 family protein [bacterium]
MRNFKKITATFLLSTIISSNTAFIAQAFADEYKVLPPVSSFNNSVNTAPQYTAPATTLQGSVSAVPSGTFFPVVMTSSLNSATSQMGEVFTAYTNAPVMLNGNTVIPENSQLVGQITYVDPAGRIGKYGVMDVRFTSVILPNGQKMPIYAKLQTTDKNASGRLKGGSVKRQLATAAGSAVIGTGGGTLAGLTTGSLMGSASGGAVFGLTMGGIGSLVYIFARKGKDVSLPSGTKLNIVLEQPITVGR